MSIAEKVIYPLRFSLAPPYQDDDVIIESIPQKVGVEELCPAVFVADVIKWLMEKECACMFPDIPGHECAKCEGILELSAIAEQEDWK